MASPFSSVKAGVMACYPDEQEQYQIEFIAGETFTLPIQYNDQEGNTVDLTGYGAALMFRDKAEATIDTIHVLCDETGQMIFNVTADQTLELYEASVRTYRVWLSKIDDSFAEVILQGAVRAED